MGYTRRGVNRGLKRGNLLFVFSFFFPSSRRKKKKRNTKKILVNLNFSAFRKRDINVDERRKKKKEEGSSLLYESVHKKMSKGQKRTEEIKKKKFLLLPSSTFRGVRTIRHTKLMRLLAILAYISSYTICPIIAPFHACVQYLDVCKPKPSKRKDDDFLPRSFPSRMGKKKNKTKQTHAVVHAAKGHV